MSNSFPLCDCVMYLFSSLFGNKVRLCILKQSIRIRRRMDLDLSTKFVQTALLGQFSLFVLGF